MIPAEAVEAAAKALYAVYPSLTDPADEATAVPWDAASEQRREEDRAQARAALEAAAPHMLAEALREAADALGGAASWSNSAPSTAQIRRWLRSRAAFIRAAHPMTRD